MKGQNTFEMFEQMLSISDNWCDVC